jgi:hypothetical protein
VPVTGQPALLTVVGRWLVLAILFIPFSLLGCIVLAVWPAVAVHEPLEPEQPDAAQKHVFSPSDTPGQKDAVAAGASAFAGNDVCTLA